MTLLTKIILFASPLAINEPNMQYKNVFSPLYIPDSSFEEVLPDLNPKNECNFSVSSKLATKKMKHFAYDCSQPTHNWLLIRSSEANYYDVLFK